MLLVFQIGFAAHIISRIGLGGQEGEVEAGGEPLAG